MKKPGLLLEYIKIFRSSCFRGFYQILLILSIHEVLDTFKRVRGGHPVKIHRKTPVPETLFVFLKRQF